MKGISSKQNRGVPFFVRFAKWPLKTLKKTSILVIASTRSVSNATKDKWTKKNESVRIVTSTMIQQELKSTNKQG